MNNIQRAKQDACNRIAEFNTHHSTALATIEEYAFEKKAFEDAFAIVKAAAQVQAGAVGTTKDAVDLAKQLMANTAIKYAMRASVKATQLGNSVLANHLNHPVTYISSANKNLAVERAKEIVKQLDDNKAILTNITAANLTDINNTITAYDAIKDSPIIDIQHKTVKGTNPLTAAFADAFKAINNMYKLVVSYFSDTNKSMVDELGLAKQLIITGTRYTGVEGTVTKDGKGVANIKVTIDGTTKTATTNTDGNYTIIKVKPSTYTVTINGAGIVAQSQTVKITRGNIEALDFMI